MSMGILIWLIKSSMKPFGFYGIWSSDQPDLCIHKYKHPKIVSYLFIVSLKIWYHTSWQLMRGFIRDLEVKALRTHLRCLRCTATTLILQNREGNWSNYSTYIACIQDERPNIMEKVISDNHKHYNKKVSKLPKMKQKANLSSLRMYNCKRNENYFQWQVKRWSVFKGDRTQKRFVYMRGPHHSYIQLSHWISLKRIPFIATE